ncbi:arabinosyltransferase AftB [Gordonia effusa NBRC 100432]|uniref:Arabinosyltransferase AftB n=1 Tax=Gordonia effusa NBRC 100432 TaxID=1077974 RepID=H0R148_9ACTN|nr:flagellar motor control protein ZomB [Gordonia effusa]GAB18799.1 arabinosyltransferase AftB [Gordonia effusa NBRC 100432]
MPTSDSAVEQAESTDNSDERSARRGVRSWGARQWTPALSWFVGAVTVSVFFSIGAWQRRWIADDGLIVLRTLRNLFAGNGPVFNAGERVEANTSTAWTYVLWFWSWVTGGQLEYVALWVALVCSVAAVPLAMYGTARLYWPSLTGRNTVGFTLLLPLGAIVYIALPPARDFATSGLENGLALLWVATLWVLLIGWARRGTAGAATKSRRGVAADLALAFTAGLAPLIRPELTILGGLALLLVFVVPQSWWTRLAIVVVAGTLPVGYQIFRMGYYAVLVPNPAIAKDASGSKWKQGFIYLSNMFGPYTLLLPVILALVAAIWILVGRKLRADVVEDEPAQDDSSPRGRWAAFVTRLRSPSMVVAVVVVAGFIDAVYWLRQGGDFMHARVLLVPLFIILLPVIVVPLTIPAEVRSRVARWQLGGAVLMAGLWITTLVWAVNSYQNILPNAGIDIGRSGIVDERRFYVTNMGNENPVTAEDYLNYPRMRAMVEKIDEFHTTGGVILPSSNYDEWYVAQLPGGKLPEGSKRQVTVYFLNLGMTSMNAPLDVRVIDQMGLAYPIAAHTDRLEDGRIGHDKVLQSEWVIAESGAYPRRPVLPGYLDEDVVRQAKVALTCPDTEDRIASYKAEPWTLHRFKSSLKQAFGFTSYRIQRNPEYEIQRCGLVMPPRIHQR